MNTALNLPVWLLVLLAFLATSRLTRLVTADYVTRRPREALIRWRGEDSPLAYLITCDWCASIYTGALVATGVILWPDNRLVVGVLLVLAASLVAGLLAQIERLLQPVDN